MYLILIFYYDIFILITFYKKMTLILITKIFLKA